MDNNKYTISTFSNGLRAVTARTDGVVSYIGVVVNAGSRDEKDLSGLAHFVEHTIFKGTRKRNSWHISDRMESVGGELNAYTSKEETVVYISAPEGYVGRSLELLSDLITESVFPKNELDRERDVIREEIYSYLDSPADSVYDEFEEQIYAGSGLAHNILGTQESIERLSSEDCRRFIDSFYTPANMTVYCVDNGDPEKNMKLIERYFGSMHHPTAPRDRVLPSVPAPFDVRKSRNNHQANTIVGTRIFNRFDDRRFAIFLLNNYLGGPCMNSRLSSELRDKRGWVYTVDSSVSLLSDTGTFMIYFGCDPQHVNKCIRIINNELDKLAQSALSERKLEKIKRQYCGQLRMTSDNRESTSMALGKSLLYFNKVNDISTTTAAVESVTAEELMEAARLLTATPLSLLSLT